MDNIYYFEVTSITGKRIRTTNTYWDKLINEKHPRMKGREKEVKEALENPIEIRRSKVDQNIYMYYKNMEDNFLCVVVRHLNRDGYIITAYVTVKIKEGELVWKK
jgi:hypothetical protein